MKKYLVGGAVRDLIMGKEPHDKDYVVIGSTPEEMLSLGYKQVGNDFPVFLDDEGTEYALARKEISTGKGYQDFKFEFGPNITLREDLERRDFTINAMAMDDKGHTIDYFNGKKDLQDKIIRHVNSEHFPEDPLRVLRACRFCATLGFDLHFSTMLLCKKMKFQGMLQELTVERVWKEIEKALTSQDFSIFLLTMEKCNATFYVLPEFGDLEKVKEPIEYHPEKTTYKHVILCLKAASRFKCLSEHERQLLNFGVFCHDLGKLKTPKKEYPKHHAHDEAGIKVVDNLCKRLKVPNEYKNFGKLSSKYHMKFYTFLDMNVKKQYDMIKAITKFQDDSILNLLYKVHVCDLTGKDRHITEEEFQIATNTKQRMQLIYSIMKGITLKDLPDDVQENLSRYQGEKFGKLYRDAMISYLKHKLNERS